MKAVCKKCQWFLALPDFPYFGECHRCTPRPEIQMNYCEVGDPGRVVWPIVDKSSFCGGFAERTPENEV